ncbi:MAG: translation initiation factor 2 [Pseudomonadota bacterium]
MPHRALTALVILPIALAACNTVTRGTMEVLQFQSTPPGATVTTTNGFSCDSTPCSIEMPRNSAIMATISRPGCATQEVAIAGMLPGDQTPPEQILRAGGVGGFVIDNASGAALELTPNPVSVTLDC